MECVRELKLHSKEGLMLIEIAYREQEGVPQDHLCHTIPSERLMKKRSAREVRLLLYRSRREMLRRCRTKRSWNPDNNQMGGSCRKVKCRSGNKKFNAVGIPLEPPANFSLEHNSGEVVQFLEELRTHLYQEPPQRPPNWHGKWIGFYADFTRIKTVATAAALVLAAEFYRLREHLPTNVQHKTPRLCLIDFHRWKKESIQTLYHLGFMDMLEVNLQPNEVPDNDDSDRRIQKFMTGKHLDPESAEDLKDGLAQLTNRLEAAEDIRLGIYDGLCEAMANTQEHAYQYADEYLRLPVLKDQWWMTGSVTNCGSEIEVVFFDQGISIPCHLPKTMEEHVKEFFQFFRISARNDAMMIKAAMAVQRSATKKSNRGKGLAQIQNLIDRAPEGQLRILSRRGEYIYQKKEAEGESVKTRTLKGDIGGTLIHWRLAVQPR